MLGFFVYRYTVSYLVGQKGRGDLPLLKYINGKRLLTINECYPIYKLNIEWRFYYGKNRRNTHRERMADYGGPVEQSSTDDLKSSYSGTA
jgi:hypothetical protein